MWKARPARWLRAGTLIACITWSTLLGDAIAAAVPYPLPPGYFSSYDQGYDTMGPKVGSKYFLTPSTNLPSVCQEELSIAQSQRPPADAQGFLAGCIDAARHAMGIYYPCDRNGDDPVCPRRR